MIPFVRRSQTDPGRWCRAHPAESARLEPWTHRKVPAEWATHVLENSLYFGRVKRRSGIEAEPLHIRGGIRMRKRDEWFRVRGCEGGVVSHKVRFECTDVRCEFVVLVDIGGQVPGLRHMSSRRRSKVTATDFAGCLFYCRKPHFFFECMVAVDRLWSASSS